MKNLFFALLLLACCSASAQDFPRSTKFELAGAAAAIAADGYTSHRLAGMHFLEYNPIARPFVKSTGGTVAYFSASFAALAAGNYLLRNHQRTRHILNFSVIGWETGLAAHNFSYGHAADRCATIWITQGRIVAPCVHR